MEIETTAHGPTDVGPIDVIPLDEFPIVQHGYYANHAAIAPWPRYPALPMLTHRHAQGA